MATTVDRNKAFQIEGDDSYYIRTGSSISKLNDYAVREIKDFSPNSSGHLYRTGDSVPVLKQSDVDAMFSNILDYGSGPNAQRQYEQFVNEASGGNVIKQEDVSSFLGRDPLGRLPDGATEEVRAGSVINNTPDATPASGRNKTTANTSTGYISAQDYFLRPGETIDQYNTRIAGLRASGKTTDPTLIGMTPDQIQKTYLSGPQPEVPTAQIDPNSISTTYSTSGLSTEPTNFADLKILLAENEKIRAKELQKAQQSYLDTISKSRDQISLEDQLADVRAKASQAELNAQAGLDVIAGQTIPMGLIIGQGKELSQQAQRVINQFRLNEQNILSALGLAQEAQQMKQQGAETQLNFLLQNNELAQKAEDRIFEQQQVYFNQAMQLDDRSRNQLADMLEILQGSNPDTWDAQTQAKVANVAAQRGLSYSMVVEGLRSVYTQKAFENQMEFMQQQRLTGTGGGGGISPDGSVDVSKLPAAIKEDLISMDTLDAQLNKLISYGSDGKLEGVGFGTGTIQSLGTKIFGTGSPETQAVQVLIGNIKATIAKLRGGTSFTANEEKLLNSYVPTINESSASILNKARGLQSFIAQKRSSTLNVASGNISSSSNSNNDPLGIL